MTFRGRLPALVFSHSVGTPAIWIGFTIFVLAMIALDLGVFNRKAHAPSVRESAGWTILWVSLSLGFNFIVLRAFGATAAVEFFSGYLIEKALSVDNLFVFLVIFSFFRVDIALQHRVLFWGIFGALILRAIFIFAGAAFVARFHWMLYVFGAFLLYTGIKLLASSDGEMDPSKNPVLRFYKRYVRSVEDFRGTSFFVRENGKLHATPLFLVLLVVEASDVIFAVDSIPAIFGITTDPFIVYTSNVFAIFGLRSMYFLLAAMLVTFHYLKFGLALVLMFIGGKMMIEPWFDITPVASLIVVSVLLVGSVVASLVHGNELRKSQLPPAPAGDGPAPVPPSNDDSGV